MCSMCECTIPHSLNQGEAIAHHVEFTQNETNTFHSPNNFFLVQNFHVFLRTQASM